MNTHTPGPWIATGYKNTVVNDSNGNTIALHPSHDGSVDNAIANARLIAASPDLLAALHKIDANCAENPEWIRTVARAAIAKATGVQQ